MDYNKLSPLIERHMKTSNQINPDPGLNPTQTKEQWREVYHHLDTLNTLTYLCLKA